MSSPVLDLLVVGAGPTGIAIGAEARRAGLEVLLIDRGPVAANLLGFPTFMEFFTTRERLEIAGIPFAIPEAKPDRRQALRYYHAVIQHYAIPLALHEEVTSVETDGDIFVVRSSASGVDRTRRTRAVAIAAGYFARPRSLGIPGEDAPWVHLRFKEPYRHFGEKVAVVGGGNSAVEAALELWRAGAAVTIVHRSSEVKEGVKYWLKPDLANRIEEGSIDARFDTTVVAFGDHTLSLAGGGGTSESLTVDDAYVLIGYEPEMDLLRDAGVPMDPDTMVPEFDPESCESSIQGLYVAGTLQAGLATNKIFIENSRDHSVRIVRHLSARLAAIE